MKKKNEGRKDKIKPGVGLGRELYWQVLLFIGAETQVMIYAFEREKSPEVPLPGPTQRYAAKE